MSNTIKPNRPPTALNRPGGQPTPTPGGAADPSTEQLSEQLKALVAKQEELEKSVIPRRTILETLARGVHPTSPGTGRAIYTKPGKFEAGGCCACR